MTAIQVHDYDNVRHVDLALVKLVDVAKKDMIAKEDDRLFVIGGRPGTGKSTLLKHIYSIYSPEPSIAYVCLTKEQFAKAHKEMKQQYNDGVTDRFLGFDEANVSKRSAMCWWNKDLLDLYFANRVFEAMHVWCNPSLEILDKPFIDERVSGVFFILNKDDKRPRKYVFFSKKAILRMLDDGLDLKHRTIEKNYMKYGTYIGLFGKYEGELNAVYKEKKIESAGEIVDTFYEHWGGEDLIVDGEIKYTVRDLCERLGLTLRSTKAFLAKCIKDKVIDIQKVQKPNGRYAFSEDDVNLIVLAKKQSRRAFYIDKVEEKPIEEPKNSTNSLDFPQNKGLQVPLLINRVGTVPRASPANREPIPKNDLETTENQDEQAHC